MYKYRAMVLCEDDTWYTYLSLVLFCLTIENKRKIDEHSFDISIINAPMFVNIKLVWRAVDKVINLKRLLHLLALKIKIHLAINVWTSTILLW